MGQELACRMHFQKRAIAGKAYLESDHILFRGEERLKILLKDLRSVTAEAGTLHLDFPGGPASLELGAPAEKWADKILHPPSRAEKLGVKPGLSVRLEGRFDSGFLAELSATERTKGPADLLFFAAASSKDLSRIPKLASGLAPSGALWVIYLKGVKEIREVEVLEAGRAAGLKDVKVASFSSIHTALKFVIPVAARG
jgi:hypothetical protein